MIRTVPTVITHNYDPDRGPFGNICNLPSADAQRILREIGASGLRRIKPDYLERRLATERWLLSERTRKLGRPHLIRPIYFFLGDFADGQDPSRPHSIQVPLAVFSPQMITFTYPDSMASLPIANRSDHAAIRKRYHGEVFTLDEIGRIVSEFGMPDKRSPTYDRFIEVQVWDDRPLKGSAQDLSLGHGIGRQDR